MHPGRPDGPELPAAIKTGIQAMVKAASGEGRAES
jgi:hypothetical protein